MSLTTRSGPPPDTESRPKEVTTRTAPSVTEPSDELRALVARAAALVAEIGDQAEREAAIDRAAFAEGYRLGFAAGQEVGYGQAEADMQRAWSAVAVKIRREANHPRFRELEERRYPDRTPDELARMRGRDRFPLPDRQCYACGGRVCGCGGAA